MTCCGVGGGGDRRGSLFVGLSAWSSSSLIAFVVGRKEKSEK
jgi:hypothetical protein